jgi:hypothetical protein
MTYSITFVTRMWRRKHTFGHIWDNYQSKNSNKTKGMLTTGVNKDLYK